jgi:hypothetical protein
MVVPEWQGKHIAHALHDELLAGRKEERATLLVRQDNGVAQTAYARWGWQKIGKLRPYLRTGGREMLAMMGGSPDADQAHSHDHGHVSAYRSGPGSARARGPATARRGGPPGGR